MRAHPHRLLAVALLLGAAAAAGANWPGFRGPRGDGVSPDRGLPVKWGPDENVVWKTKLPGPGTSSPIVWGDRVFLTCDTGREAARKNDVAKVRRHLLCVDRKSGKILWQKDVPAKLPENDYNRYLQEHGYVSSTPVTDGERVYVFFGRTGVLAFDFAGSLQWHVEVGQYLNSWGSAASLVLYKDLLIVNASVESSALLALDRKTGKRVWRLGGIRDCWTTPVLVEVPGGKQELVFNTPGQLLGIDPEKGTKLWECEGVETTTPTSSPVAHNGIVYAMGAAMKGTRAVMAVRPGGRGDVTKTHVVWKQKGGTNHSSPLVYQGRLYYVTGLITCLKADTGKPLFNERLYEANMEYVSPVAADGKIFVFTRRSGAYVLEAGDKLKVLAHNELGDRNIFNGSPAISGGQLFVRSDTYLYCLGSKQKE
jgi:outer membrane protein assembly factor BamB